MTYKSSPINHLIITSKQPKWTPELQEPVGRTLKHHSNEVKSFDIIPTTVNGQISSSNNEESVNCGKSESKNRASEPSVSFFNNVNVQRKDHKILITGDSHIRGCNEKVKSHLFI